MSEATEATEECPGEAHELDGHFNPSGGGPYGPGYHYCEVCEGENYITPEQYDQYELDQLQNKLSGNKFLPS